MSELLTESFCERCGTRYTFETAEPEPNRPGLKKARVLARGFKNFVMSDDVSLDTAMTEAQRDEDSERAALQLEAFHQTFNFCMDCRQYTCRDCWNEGEGRCLSCAPAPGRIESVLAGAGESESFGGADRLAALLAPPAPPAPTVPLLSPRIEAWPLESEIESLELTQAEAAPETVPEPATFAPSSQPTTPSVERPTPMAPLFIPAPPAPVAPIGQEPAIAQETTIEQAPVIAPEPATAPASEPPPILRPHPPTPAPASQPPDILRPYPAAPGMVNGSSAVPTPAAAESGSERDTTLGPVSSLEAALLAAAAAQAAEAEEAPAELAAEAVAPEAAPTPEEAPTPEAAHAPVVPVAPLEPNVPPAPAPSARPVVVPSIVRPWVEPPTQAAPEPLAVAASAAPAATPTPTTPPPASTAPPILTPIPGPAATSTGTPAPRSVGTGRLPGWDMVAPETPGQPTATRPRARASSMRDVQPAAWFTARSGGTFWDASSVEVTNRAGAGIQSCVSCGLPLSASAHFCRRCGSRQAA